MKPVRQLYRHDPANGVYGDCWRACIASVLELPIEDVPHEVMISDPSSSPTQRTIAWQARWQTGSPRAT